MPSEKQNAVKITKGDVKRKLKSVPDWKIAGPDKIQGFWLNLSQLYLKSQLHF